MMRNIRALAMVLVSSMVLISCGSDDADDDFAPIVGIWQGTAIEYEFKPDGAGGLGYSDTEDFDAVVEFKEDGTVIYSNDGDESNGTYKIMGNKLTTTVEFASDLPFTAQSFTIKKLSDSKLELYFEDEGEFDIPDFGTVQGELQATAFFNRQ
jgi:uncharacterized protein (TIGR03066 family)